MKRLKNLAKRFKVLGKGLVDKHINKTEQEKPHTPEEPEEEKFRVLLFYPNEPMVGVVPSNLAYLAACLKEWGGHEVKLFDCSLYKSIRYEPRPDGEEGGQLTVALESKSKEADFSEKMLKEGPKWNLREKLGHVKKSPIEEYVTLKETSPYDDFLKLVEEYKPHLIGITVVDSTIEFAHNFIQQIPGEKPTIVMGGTGATFSWEKILEKGYADFVCRGEGEEALVELCDRLKAGEDCSDVKNFWLKGPDGNVIKNPQRTTVDIDTLPMPDFSIYDPMRFYRPFMGRVVRMAQIDWDRGCPYQCTYCAAPALVQNNRDEGIGKYYRVKNEDKIFEEMHFLIKEYDLDFLYISSETLLKIRWPKFKRIADRYMKEIKLPFWAQSRLDSFTDEKTKLLKEMGCQSVSLGLEHGDEEVRQKLLKKKLPNSQVFKGIENLAKYNIRPTINSMMGLPDETREQVFKTFEINREISKILKGNHNLNVFTFVPFSGTHLRDICIEKGYIDPDEPIPFSFYKESMLTMPSMTKAEIAGLEKTAALYIELPKEYWPEIKIAEQHDEEGEEMFEKLIAILNQRRSESEVLMAASREEDHLASPMVNFGGKIDYK